MAAKINFDYLTLYFNNQNEFQFQMPNSGTKSAFMLKWNIPNAHVQNASVITSLTIQWHWTFSNSPRSYRNLNLEVASQISNHWIVCEDNKV